MAEILDFPETNLLPTAPEDAPNVRDLPCYRDNNGVISCWQLTAAEMAEVARAGRVWLHVQARTHPPVYVGGVSPFKKPAKGEATDGD